MGKYCTYCGKKLEEGEVCNCCPEAAAEPSKKEEAAKAEPEKTKSRAVSEDGQTVDLGIAISETAGKVGGFFKKNLKKIIIGGVALVVIIATLITVLCITAGNYKTPIKNLVNEINKGTETNAKTIAVAACLKSTRKLYEETQDIYEAIDEASTIHVANMLSAKFENLSDEYEDWKLEFDFVDAEKLSKSELEDCQEELEEIQDEAEKIVDEYDENEDEIEEYAEELEDDDVVSKSDYLSFVKSAKKYFSSFEKMKITEGYEVKGRYILYDGKDKISSTDKKTITVVKISGEWVIWDTDYFDFDSDDENYSLYYFLSSYTDSSFKDGWDLGY